MKKIMKKAWEGGKGKRWQRGHRSWRRKRGRRQERGTKRTTTAVLLS